MSTNLKQGKEFEDFLTGKVFLPLKSTYALSYHKLVDSGSAGNIVGSQPSDFLVGANKTLMYLEAKTSTGANFTRSLLRPAQRKAILFDGVYLEIPYWILFWSLKTRKVSIIDGVKALEGTRIDLEKCSFQCTRDQLQQELAKLWKLKTLKEILKERRNDNS